AFFILTWAAPAGSLVSGASTGLPFGHAIAGAEDGGSVFFTEPLDVTAAPAFSDTHDGGVRLHQEHRGDARNPECVAGPEFVLGIEEGREGDAELAVEVARVFGVVLGDSVNAEGAALVEAFEVG